MDLQEIFHRYAKPAASTAQQPPEQQQPEQQQYVLHRDGFVRALRDLHGIHPTSNNTTSENTTQDRDLQYAALFDIADEQGRGWISLTEFTLFRDLLKKPRAEYEIVFRLFDLDKRGKVSFPQFVQVLKERVPKESRLLQTLVDQEKELFWVRLYFGDMGASGANGGSESMAKKSKNKKELSLEEFGQLVKGLHEERLRLEFLAYDPEGTGYISAENFVHLTKTLSQHKLTPFVEQHLATLGNLYVHGGTKVSWAVVAGFHNFLRQLDLMRHLARIASKQSKDGTISKSDFTRVAQENTRSTVFTPVEVDILFHLARLCAEQSSGVGGGAKRHLQLQDFEALVSSTLPQSPSVVVGNQASASKVTAATTSTTTTTSEHPSHLVTAIPSWAKALRVVYNFALGSIAGAIGATVVYPIDLVKTRMQNQRSAVVGQLMYKNSMDCFRKVIRNEGVRGLYSGLGPQLVGVAPEKAIKLTMNDLARRFLTNTDSGTIPLWGEILAGCIAGGSQVVFTNPLEIVKIRLQVQGEAGNAAVRRSAVDIVKELGLVGLYKGATACLLRDIPFSGIYFTAYAHLKSDYFGESESKRLSMGELLMAGAIAGMPAAYLTTPADVIKTRLQVEAKKGQSTYTGIRDAFTKILKEEGPRALFKGGPARIFRSSPQFGVTLMSYELLQQWLPFPWSPSSAPSLSKQEEGKSTGYGHAASSATPVFPLRNVVRVLQDIDYKFGGPYALPTVTAGSSGNTSESSTATNTTKKSH